MPREADRDEPGASRGFYDGRLVADHIDGRPPLVLRIPRPAHSGIFLG
jgi:hypothetical protein